MGSTCLLFLPVNWFASIGAEGMDRVEKGMRPILLIFYFADNRFIIGTCSILLRSDYDGLSNVNMSSIRRAATDVEYQCHDGLYRGDLL